jgi:small subunit ribosomal protein S1
MTLKTASLAEKEQDPQAAPPANESKPPTGTEKSKAMLHKRLTDWLDNQFDYHRPRRGEVREALILDISENDVVVDIDAKRDGVVPPSDLDLLPEEYRESLQVGDRVPVVVMRPREQTEGVPVSLNKGLQQKDWLRAKSLEESGEIIEAEVIDVNRGGLLVKFGRLRAFVPNSHLTSVPRGMRGEQLREAKEDLIGKTIHLVVIEVEQRRRRLVLSERKANRRRRAQLLNELTEGEVRTGMVTNLVKFGAFVDLGGADGLIHISELDWQHVEHPSEVVQVGDEVEVYVLSVDRERQRIGLSRKRLLPDPWHVVTERLAVGQIVKGTVTNTVDFGAFVDLGQGIEGLVHVSEMPAQQATLAELRPGSPISVRVIEIDPDRRRIALSLRGISGTMAQAFQDQWDELDRLPVDV